ncbi:hypothetical protein NKG05_13510 [Oerskovia sp. M15]
MSVLVVLLSGLSSGLVNDGVSGLKKLPVAAFAFGADTSVDSAFSRSTVDREQAERWAARDDVADAALFGNQLVNAEGPGGEAVDLALFGVEPGSFVAPSTTDLATGRSSGTRTGSSSARPWATWSGHRGHRDDRTAGHRAHDRRRARRAAHVRARRRRLRTLATWQEIHAGATDAAEVRPEAYDEATAVALAPSTAPTSTSRSATRPPAPRPSRSRSPSTGHRAMRPRRSRSTSSRSSSTRSRPSSSVRSSRSGRSSASTRSPWPAPWAPRRRTSCATPSARRRCSRGVHRGGHGRGRGLRRAAHLDPHAVRPRGRALALAAVLLVGLGLAGAAASVGRIAHVDPLTALGGQR